ncbi:MAG TPA: hypothetical protein VNS31_04860 [Ramlibacter sp.]|jgi:hypothetical protein|nr:hypothetical protein [Ramlibacter sp.]
MSTFSTTVFRIRLLLLAVALGLMGFGEVKKAPQMADSAHTVKAVKAHQRQPQPSVKVVAVQPQAAATCCSSLRLPSQQHSEL